MNSITRFFRKIPRLAAIVFFLIWQYFAAAIELRRASGSEKEMQRAIARRTRLWAGGLLKILGITCETAGDLSAVRENGGLLISNHQSYLDILVHAAAAGMRFAPNAGIRSWPFFGR